MKSITKRHSFDEVFDSQKVFRLLLTAMSNPPGTVSIAEFAGKLYGDNKGMLVLAMTLLDNEVSFNTCENARLSDEIISLTLSRKERLENADYIFVAEEEMLQFAIDNAKCGTLSDPHKSATIIIRYPETGSVSVRLRGPGIKGTFDFKASDIAKKALDIRDSKYYEYPQGVDFIFISDNGDLFSIPRLIFKEVL